MILAVDTQRIVQIIQTIQNKETIIIIIVFDKLLSILGLNNSFIEADIWWPRFLVEISDSVSARVRLVWVNISDEMEICHWKWKYRITPYSGASSDLLTSY